MIDLPSELETRLQTAALQKGISANDFALLLLEERLSEIDVKPFWTTSSGDEWLKAFNQWMDSHDATLPPLSDETVSRDSFYGERG